MRDKIATSSWNTITEVFDAATTHEMVMDSEKSKKQGKATTQPKVTTQTTTIAKQFRQSQPGNNMRKWEEPPYEKCKNCGWMHVGWCREPMKCFNCGREGYKKKDYRLRTKQLNEPDRTMVLVNKSCPCPAALANKGKAKLYTVEVDEDDKETRMVKGTILIKGDKYSFLFRVCTLHCVMISQAYRAPIISFLPVL